MLLLLMYVQENAHFPAAFSKDVRANAAVRLWVFCFHYQRLRCFQKYAKGHYYIMKSYK